MSDVDMVASSKDVYLHIDGRKNPYFDAETALALLLLDQVIHLNSNWWEDEWPEEAKEMMSINVNCSDVFAWACSDSEPCPFKQLQSLYDHWMKDPTWGPAIWCIKRRKQMPQAPVIKLIKEQGIWDLDKIAENNYEQEENQDS